MKLNVHSIIDVITNSSTEMFICNTDKTVEVVKELLDAILSAYNKAGGGTRPLDEIMDVFIAEQPEYDSAICEDYGISWDGKKTIIEGKDDNSIPYWMWEIIENLFNAERHHLG